MYISTLEQKFPSLVRISFLEVEELHDSHLQALASSKLPIQELQIGDAIWGQDAEVIPSNCNISDKVGLHSFGSYTLFANSLRHNVALKCLPGSRSQLSVVIQHLLLEVGFRSACRLLQQCVKDSILSNQF